MPTKEQWIEHVAAGRSDVLVASDFDGTLARIGEAPERVHLDERARGIVRRLAATPRVHFAILTGRTLADVIPRVDGLGPIWICADHGSVLIDPLRRMRFFERDVPRERFSLVRARIEALAARTPGARCELKTHGVAVHFREVPEDHVAALVEQVRAVATEAEAHVLAGRRVVEARFANGDEGSALAAILAALPDDTACVYAGDDATDEPALAVAYEREDGLALFVRSHERPAAGTPVHDTLAGPDAWLELLESLTAALAR